jgi:hypothetical protein
VDKEIIGRRKSSLNPFKGGDLGIGSFNIDFNGNFNFKNKRNRASRKHLKQF